MNALKQIVKYTSFAALLLFFASCEDVIDVELEEGPKQLVIDGRITDDAPAFVRLSTTGAYFDKGQTPRVEGAVIRLLEDGNFLEELSEDSVPGLYVGMSPGTIGRSYQIEVEIPDGTSFRASNWKSKPELIKRIFEIDSLYFSFFNQPPLPVGDYLNFRTKPYDYQQNELFRIRRTLNDSAFLQDFLFINDGIELNSFRFRPVINQVIEPGDSIVLEFSSISRAYREYLQVLVQQLNPGGLFDPPPTPIRGNLVEEGGEGQIALGFFAGSAIVREGIRKD